MFRFRYFHLSVRSSCLSSASSSLWYIIASTHARMYNIINEIKDVRVKSYMYHTKFPQKIVRTRRSTHTHMRWPRPFYNSSNTNDDADDDDDFFPFFFYSFFFRPFVCMLAFLLDGLWRRERER